MTLPRTITKIPVHLYGGTLLFAKTRKDFEKAYKWLHGSEYPDDTADGAGLTVREPLFKDGVVYYLCGVFDSKLETTCHEASHCTTLVMKRAGINSHDDDGESTAYLMEFLFMQIHKKVFEQPKKRKVILETTQIKDTHDSNSL